MRTRFLTYISVFICLILTISGFSLYKSPGSIYAQSLEEELQRIQEERENLQNQINEISKTESKYNSEVNNVEIELRGALLELDELNARLADAKAGMDRTTIELVLREEELKQIESELEDSTRILNDRMTQIYKSGGNNILEVLLKADDFIELVSRMKLMSLFAQQDTENIQDIKEKRDATLGIKRSILDLRDVQKENKEKIEILLSQSEAKADDIGELYDEKQALLNQTKANKRALQAMEKDLEIQEAEVTRILESYKYGTAPSGKFMWPIAGSIKSGFGYRIHPIFGYRRFHSGLDLISGYGDLVKAADGGQVIQAGYSGGYGNTVLIYHGGGFATRYAHLSSIRCSVGQMVARGQVIGLVGATGWATGPHLHFEIRINGQAQNPLKYLE